MRIPLSDTLAPHYCHSCGEIGAVLCLYCKYDISSEPYAICVSCSMPTSGSESLCIRCEKPYGKLWCVGARSDVLQKLIADYKFNRTKDAYRVFASLLDTAVPQLPTDTVVVAVPTVRAHIRQRGYDHAALIAKEFARIRQLEYSPVLQRINNEAQRGANRKQRIEQAGRAFCANNSMIKGTYLLIDDVLTTGATVESATRVLKAAGAREVWVAVIAHQPLEKHAII